MNEISKISSKILTIVMVTVATILLFNRYDATHNQKRGATTSMTSKLIFKVIPKLIGQAINDKEIHQEVKEGFTVIKSDIKDGINGDFDKGIETIENEIKTNDATKTIEDENNFKSVVVASEKESKEFEMFIKK
jgi:hypothetical protein